MIFALCIITQARRSIMIRGDKHYIAIFFVYFLFGIYNGYKFDLLLTLILLTLQILAKRYPLTIIFAGATILSFFVNNFTTIMAEKTLWSIHQTAQVILFLALTLTFIPWLRKRLCKI